MDRGRRRAAPIRLGDALLGAIERSLDRGVHVPRLDFGSTCGERRLAGELRQQMRVVGQPLREPGNAVDGGLLDRHLCCVDPLGRDLGQLLARHPRHANLNQGSLDRAMLADELVDVVCDADEDERRSDDAVGERLDRLREESPVVVIHDAVELVDKDRQRALSGQALPAAGIAPATGQDVATLSSKADAGSLPSAAAEAKPTPWVVVRRPISPSAFRQMLE